jgi:hypothetical protein
MDDMTVSAHLAPAAGPKPSRDKGEPIESDAEAAVWQDLSRRKLAEGERLGRVLLFRLGIEKDVRAALAENERFMRALARWAIEFPLNIQWYDQAIPRQQRVFGLSRGLSLGLGLATIVGTTVLVLLNQGVNTSQFGVLIAGIFGVMQLLAAGSDPKAQLGGFRKARADLKESMFTFQETWRGRVVITDAADPDKGLPSPDFMTALYQEIRTGRKIAREERDTFFGTFKSPTEILGVASSAVDVLRSRRTELVGAIKDAGAGEVAHDAAVAARIQDLRNKLNEANALKAALEDKKRRLEIGVAAKSQLDDVQAKIEEAETDRFKTQKLLDLAVKSDVANPI